MDSIEPELSAAMIRRLVLVSGGHHRNYEIYGTRKRAVVTGKVIAFDHSDATRGRIIKFKT